VETMLIVIETSVNKASRLPVYHRCRGSLPRASTGSKIIKRGVNGYVQTINLLKV
jgi:hypothetical protein